jgi:hypothetical protein
MQEEFSTITVDEIVESPYLKNGNKVFQAQLRQTVTKTYPGARHKNSFSDSLFGTDEFNFGPGQSYASDRLVWMMVPEGTTVEDVQKRLKPENRIWRILSNKVDDVMTDEQKYAIKNGDQTLEHYEDKLRVRDSEGKDLPGEPMYRQYFFSNTRVEDVDLRGNRTINVAARVLEAADTQEVF